MKIENIKINVVAGVLLELEGKYLLVQEKQPKAYKKWNLPAGKVDVGETLEEATVREAQEETGFEVRLLHKIGIYQNLAQEPVKHIYKAEIVGGKLAIPENEMLDARWFTVAEIKDMKDQLRNAFVLDSILDNLKKEN
jgi:ADP-ribose pyrophosphatase YjhB (NUDIX family)